MNSEGQSKRCAMFYAEYRKVKKSHAISAAALLGLVVPYENLGGKEIRYWGFRHKLGVIGELHQFLGLGFLIQSEN
jgi:hypothetical protein